MFDEATTYTYDANDRLKTETFDLGMDGSPEKLTSYLYGASNTKTQLTSKSVLEGGSVAQTDYVYNRQGRLESVIIDADDDGTPESVSTYAYDASGIRVSVREQVDEDDDGTFDTDTTTVHHVDHHNPTGYAQVLEEKVSGAVTRSYTLGHDVLAQAESSGSIYHFLYDGHGSTRLLLDESGNLASKVVDTVTVPQAFAYDAYGNLLALPLHAATPEQSQTTLLYSGEQTDVTGLQYLRARYYDGTVGRFTRLDPFAGSMQDPLTLHKYLYAHANPIMIVDPSGLMGLVSVGFAGSLRTSLSNMQASVGEDVMEAVYAVCPFR